jgi:hypothetical protein
VPLALFAAQAVAFLTQVRAVRAAQPLVSTPPPTTKTAARPVPCIIALARTGRIILMHKAEIHTDVRSRPPPL